MKSNKIKTSLFFLTAVAMVLIYFGASTTYAKTLNSVSAASADNYIYGIGSVSKMFCTAAVMKLVDEGKVNLDTPVTKYISDFSMLDERYKKITTKMLLNHSSGLMGTTFHNGFLFGNGDTSFHDNFLKELKSQRLKADPGEYSVYCNDGFTLAEILVERVSGMSFSDYIEKEISKPLGLNNTLTPQNNLMEKSLAPVYFGGYTLPYVNCQTLASGGIYGTPDDLCRFSQIFMKDGKNMLSKSSVDLMAKPWYLQDKIGASEGDSQIGYGLGWDCVNAYPYNLYNIKALTKSGDVEGYHTGLTVLPEQNISVAVTTSGGSSTYCEEMAQDIILKVLKEEGMIDNIKDIKVQAKTEDFKTPLPEEMRKYSGYYSAQNMLSVEFTEDGKLLLKTIGGQYDTVQEYVYTKSGEFISTKGYYLDGTGNLVSNANGNKGQTKLKFSKQPNGKTYIMGTTYESTMGLGELAYSIPFAEKIEQNDINENMKKAWEERNGKKYYLADEVYNSNAFLECPIREIRLSDKIPGYAAAYVKDISEKLCSIKDENSAICNIDLPGMIGRDLNDLSFYRNGAIDYFSFGAFSYVGEEMVKASTELADKYVIPTDNNCTWYKVAEKDTGAVLEITAPFNGAYYVYDKDENCVLSSIFNEKTTSVVLPEKGHLVFAGKKGAMFSIKKD